MDFAQVITFPGRRLIAAFDVDPAEVAAQTLPFAVPSAYRCSLDKIANGPEATAWQEYVHGLPYMVETMDRPTFRELFPNCTDTLPLIAFVEGNSLEVVVSATNIADATNLADLKWTMDASLSTRAPVEAVTAAERLFKVA
jgi:hypothetical protein